MKRFIKSIAGKIILAILALLLIAAGTLGGIVAANPKFQDVTIELGGDLPSMESFLTEFAIDAWAELVTPAEEICLDQAGQQALTFRHGLQEETVTLTVQDTVAPTATFQDVSADIGTELKPEDFVVEMDDLSPMTVSFAQPLTEPESYGEVYVEVLVTDASGNATSGRCRIRYAWMHESCTLEFGQPLEKYHLLLNPEKDADLIDQAELDAINAAGVGEYTVTSTDGDLSYECKITVQDTTGPELVLKEVTIYSGGKANLNSFVVSATDLSGDVTLRLVTELDRKSVGEHPVTVEAEDIYGNVTTAQTILKVIKDSAGPSFAGTDAIVAEKNSAIDFRAGVTAYDTKDGYVDFTVDSSKVKISTAGTYYAIYTATDSSGNTATYRRKITIIHDSADRAALVASVAAKLSSDPLKIRSWCLNNINYQSSVWAREDPVWYGLTNRNGNCYVQANCLKALLEAKGYQAQLIWTTCKTHYWVLVYYNGAWRHIDSTPGRSHDDILLVTDDVRYAHLQGRNWDRTKWPAAE